MLEAGLVEPPFKPDASTFMIYTNLNVNKLVAKRLFEWHTSLYFNVFKFMCLKDAHFEKSWMLLRKDQLTLELTSLPSPEEGLSTTFILTAVNRTHCSQILRNPAIWIVRNFYCWSACCIESHWVCTLKLFSCTNRHQSLTGCSEVLTALGETQQNMQHSQQLRKKQQQYKLHNKRWGTFGEIVQSTWPLSDRWWSRGSEL